MRSSASSTSNPVALLRTLAPVGMGVLLLLGGRARAEGEVTEAVSDRVVATVLKDTRSRRSEQRLAAWRRLTELGPRVTPWRDEIDASATRAAENAFADIQAGATVDDLRALRARRTELDCSRAIALDLIRDTQRYFYPSTVPDVTVERARLYPEVRREVERRVAVVRALWEGAEGVEVPEGVRAAAAELVWIERAATPLSIDVVWPRGLPRWILGVAETTDRIDLRNFAWTREQSSQLLRDRAVRAYNEHRWAEIDASDGAAAADEPGYPGPVERDQVRLTNGYRRMLGECALAWSEPLQRAAHGHSQYMATRAVLTHATSLPGHETPAARMRSAGYRFGRAENIYFGPGGALAAHVLWVGSSGHHRALLDPQLRGMASAEVDGYWTQDLGTSTSFTGNPDYIESPWHD